MSKVKVLDQHVANMIAAGEVVENPASVVKELLENAIDAKSSSVTVEIQNGGISYIRITDDGIGMERDDAKCAFLRHATSKISNADDLECIHTLGFRGEALAAISSVSKIDLITKTADSDMGIALRVEAGKVVRESESGCPDGTTIVVRELFYNTPARMRFLKKDATEAAAVESVVKSAALSHPEVSVKFIKDGRDILHTPGDGVVKSCMYALFGRDFANGMLDVECVERGMKVTGFASTPIASRGNRTLQFFFVNGRPVKSRMLSVALDNAYKERIMKGRFPTCVLMLDIPLGQVDVNVHPAKTEVKFARERDVFDIVYFGVKSALEKSEKREIKPPMAINRPDPVDNITEQQTRIELSPPEVKREEKKDYVTPREKIISPEEIKKDISPNFERRNPEERVMLRSPIFERLVRRPEEKEETVIPKKRTQENVVNDEVETLTAVLPEEKETPVCEKKEIEPIIKFVGETMNTYIIVEKDETVIFIDKHAAHERIIFEKLKAEKGAVQSQILLTPEIVETDKTLVPILIENREELLSLGFDVDDFGDGRIVISAIPDGIDTSDAVAILDSLSETMKGGARPALPEIMAETMYSVACKAAIKAGQKNSPEELMSLAKRVLLSDDIRYCPHGRPVMFEMSKTELEKKFKRIV
ncbi:MAG: DNA mismatch repair endonuclease MutL [Oscillospiraceae bacterium]|nr:DNA mismatch repair endonuclease MutL [Oscillospiraceae bacterium]